MSEDFKAILVTKEGDEKDSPQQANVTDLTLGDLMEGDVVIDVEYSTINYKDGLSITGASPIARFFPMIPGIDLAGRVAQSSHAHVKEGDAVLINGYGLSESHFGGYTQKARVKGDWIVPLPSGITSAQAMAIGTAGYTAMLCVLELEKHAITPDRGPIVVTGAAGGVGSVAIAILAKLGYEVIASTGRGSESDYLKGLGASDIIDRNELSEKGRPLGKQRWAGAVDTVGGMTLANVLANTQYDGCVTACGLAGGVSLPSTVMPFILRDVTLAGVDSVMATMDKRLRAWERLGSDLDLEKLNAMTETIGLADVLTVAPDILAGKIRGRTVVDVNA